MFYDERIEGVKGRCARNVIIMSVIFSLAIGVLRALNIFCLNCSIWYLAFLAVDLTMFLAGSVILITGASKGSADERDRFERFAFYNKALLMFIKIVGTVFALGLPFAIFFKKGTQRIFDLGFSCSLTLTLSIAFLYAVYIFKKNDIYFNYSLIEGEKYYKGVFNNIGKFALWIVGAMLISVVSYAFVWLMLEPSRGEMLKLAVSLSESWFGKWLLYSVIYLIYSVLERSSFNSNRLISRSCTVSVFASLGFKLLWIGTITILVGIDLTDSDAAEFFTTYSGKFDFYVRLFFAVFLTYFGYEYSKNKPSKLLSAAFKLALAITVIRQIMNIAVTGVTNSLIAGHLNDPMSDPSFDLGHAIQPFFYIPEHSYMLCMTAAIFLLVIALVRDKSVSRFNIASLAVIVLLWCGYVYVSTQQSRYDLDYYQIICEFAVLLYLAVLTAFVAKRRIK